MLHLLQSIDLEKIVNSGIAIALVSSLFFLLLGIGKTTVSKVEKDAMETKEYEYPFDEADCYK